TLTPGELMELQDVCAKIPSYKCGPVILRTRKLVTELEPKVGELSRIFRSVLCDCLDKVEGDKDMRVRGRRLESETQQVLSSITFQTCINPK
ncbi:protein RD3-like, partial [Salvelinus fontinalis]|uniref:protein RD3-like n=1 Tax=Salvelinus fontinalis TaxID=8038 RepID=UPI002484EF38